MGKTKEKDITETYGGSPVTSNAQESTGETEISLKDAKITVPESALTPTTAPAEKEAPKLSDFEAADNTFDQRALDASIGLVRVDGLDFRYVGRSPSHPDESAEHPTGLKLSSMNTTFTPLSEVAFHPSIRVKIGDEFFFPTTATSWADVELNGVPLVPKKADKAHTKARFEAANA